MRVLCAPYLFGGLADVMLCDLEFLVEGPSLQVHLQEAGTQGGQL
jgi:hypothetical protein